MKNDGYSSIPCVNVIEVPMAPTSSEGNLTRIAALKRKAPEPESASDIPVHPSNCVDQRDHGCSNAYDDQDGPDSWLSYICEEGLDSMCLKSWLQWKEGAGTHLRKGHSGTGRSSMFARQAEQCRQNVSSVNSRPIITSYFAPSPLQRSTDHVTTPEIVVAVDIDEDEQPDFNENALNDAINELNSIIQIRKDKASGGFV
jgi:hypothetical protein